MRLYYFISFLNNRILEDCFKRYVWNEYIPSYVNSEYVEAVNKLITIVIVWLVALQN